MVMATTAHPHDDVRIYHKEAKALAKAGLRVTIVNLQHEGIDADGIAFIKAGQARAGRLGRMTLGVGAVLKTILALRPQICHLHDPELLPIVPMLKGKGITVIYDSHEKLKDQILSKSWVPAGLRSLTSRVCGVAEQRFCGDCDGIIAATGEIAESLKGAVVIKNLPTAEDYSLIHTALYSESPKPHACYIGSISEQRGIFTIIKAAHQAGVPLRLAGAFESEALYQKAQAMEEWGNVSYEGVVDRGGVARLLASCSVGLLLLDATPSYTRSLPIKLYEYLAGGLYVVASDFAYWRSLGLEGQIRFVSPDDPIAIAREIRSACAESQQQGRRVERAERFQEQHSFGSQEQTLLALYDRLLGSF